MCPMCSKLLMNSKLQIPTPRGKIIQKMKFLSVNQNSYLGLKLDSTRVSSFSQTESWKCINRIFMQNCVAGLHRKMYFLTKVHFEILRSPLVLSKWVERWSRILVSSLSWSYTQIETNMIIEASLEIGVLYLESNGTEWGSLIRGWFTLKVHHLVE